MIYLIPLPNRTELLVGLTSGLKRFTADVTDQRLATEVASSVAILKPGPATRIWPRRSSSTTGSRVPIRELLTENQIDTLVVVPDGALRTIPFAALHDGEHFLIQNYALAVTPGLSLVEAAPDRKRTRAAAAEWVV